MKHDADLEQSVSMFETGRSPATASRMDPRFSFCTYVPTSFSRRGTRRYPLAVIVHGSERSMERYRDQFVDFAEEHQAAVLCPLFPVNALYQGDLHSYKLLRGHGVRYDEILLDMVDEFASKYPIERGKFLLYGFSGGGQFSHRFLYAHPDRLRGVAIGAPGTVTLIDEAADYWVGTNGFQALFGKPVDVGAIRKVAVQMLIGEDDLRTRWCEVRPTDQTFWMPGANSTGITRVARMEALRDNFESHGIAVDYRTFPHVAHEDDEMLGDVKAFFARSLTEP
ncbi:alpha/beta hydrolase [Pseudoroseicyclus sp. CXY001]|uniref:alpha/beta hydrolase n=1 Tax=Pseudoroseicyclus sp. CXY001 TaxID=3242492 RepID=UPI00358DBCE0